MILARVPTVILSDRTLREPIAEGRIVIEPFDDHASSRRPSTCASSTCSGCSATTPPG